VWGGPGRFLLPAGLLVLARNAPRRAAPDDLDVALLVVAGLVLLGAAVLALVRARPVVERLPLAGVIAAAGLLALDVPELRSAGALLGAGAVLALVGEHPAALLALVPGTAAAVHVAGLATQPEHAAVGAAVLAVLAAGTAGRLQDPAARPWPGLVALAAAFSFVPLWGWSGADTADHQVAVAVVLATTVLGVAASQLLDPATGWSDHLARATGRLKRRPGAAPSHASPPDLESLAEAAHQEEAGASPS
jgi:hypothetical protein